jgi:hypothetical protein
VDDDLVKGTSTSFRTGSLRSERVVFAREFEATDSEPHVVGKPAESNGGGVRPGETKAQKFERIAERRVNETLRTLRLLGNLSDRRNYSYTDEQVAMILAAVEQEYRSLKARFKAEAVSEGQTFRFKKGE